MTSSIVLVGHCGPDMFMLRSAVQRIAPSATIEVVNDQSELADRLGSGHVLLVNRVLDGRFETENGAELIGGILRDGAQARALLVSNFADAQADAVAAGAMPGFGKSELYDDRTADRIRAALDQARPDDAASD